MKKLAVAAFALLVAGCATIVKGTSQMVVVNTPGVPGATCVLTSPTIGSQTVVTPGSLTLKKGSENIAVRCTKACYQDGVGVIPSNFEGMAAGNVILGGVIGLGVDAATGAMNQYAPEVQVVMTRTSGCGAAPPARH